MPNTRLLCHPEVEVRARLSRSPLDAVLVERTVPRPWWTGRRAVAWPENAIAPWIRHRPVADLAALLPPVQRPLTQAAAAIGPPSSHWSRSGRPQAS